MSFFPVRKDLCNVCLYPDKFFMNSHASVNFCDMISTLLSSKIGVEIYRMIFRRFTVMKNINVHS